MIPGFETLAKLGEGGMGTVYRARQLSLDRIVALKILPQSMSLDHAGVERFKREAKAAAQLNHPGIVQIYESGEFQGTYYYAMEYVEGYTVGAWLKHKEVIPEDQALIVAIEVAEALNYAWTKAHLIHRDIKPENVLISEEGVVKVADLGLAKMVDSRMTVTMPGDALGTPNYCSPEQAQGQTNVDCRTDIYSLGAMLYNMVTGKVPFGEFPGIAAVVRHVSHQLDDPFEINPSLSAGIVLLLERMMAKKPEHRYADWQELMADLKRVSQWRPPRVPLPAGVKSTVKISPQTRTVLAERKGRPGARPPARTVFRKEAAGAAASPIDRLMATSIRKSSREKMVPILVSVALLLLGTLVIFVASTARRDGRGSRPVPAVRPWTGGTDAGRKEAEAERSLKQARDYAARHPQDYDGAIGKFKEAEANTRGTRFQPAVEDETRRLEKDRQTAVAKMLDDLRLKADALVNQGRKNEAVALFRTYSGPFADATVSQRETLAKSLESGGDAVIKEIFDMAMEFARRNPGEYDNAIKRFEEVLERARGTSYEAKVRNEIRRIEQARSAQTTADRTKAANAPEPPPETAPKINVAMTLGAGEKRYLEVKQQSLTTRSNEVVNLENGYLRVLKDMEEFFRKAGDRGKLGQVQAERSRFQRDRTVPLNAPATLPDEVKGLQKQYHQRKGEIDLIESRALTVQAADFVAFLSDMEKRLQSLGQANEISKVRDVHTRVMADPDLVQAQKILKAAAAAAKKP